MVGKLKVIFSLSQSHVPIFAHGEVKRVLIIGGGDDGANYVRQCQTAFDLIISDVPTRLVLVMCYSPLIYTQIVKNT